MAKIRTNYVCQQCGASTPRWAGKCPHCGTWSSLVETIEESQKGASYARSKLTPEQRKAELIPLQQIEKIQLARRTTGVAEFDRVLGGGIVPGMVVLLAGEPGIGKSTLLLELASRLSQNVSSIAYSVSSKVQNKARKLKDDKDENASTHNTQYPIHHTILYVAGEESPHQIKIRAERLGIGNAPITVLPQTNVDIITEVIEAEKPAFVFVDSVQTLKTDDLTSTFGSVGQVRESVDRLTRLAKRLKIPTFFVGHVTKEGNIAGPKVLEHIVDTVLVLEGDEAHNFRILRTEKNRFGSTDEVGVFTMDENGLNEVTNPSQIFLSERLTQAPGSVVVPTMEGTRPILVEIQALTAPTTLALPRRVGQGIDYNRMQLLLAILSRHFNSTIAKLDVFVNIAGGLKVNEPAIDLGVCLAVASAFTGTALSEQLACFGEVGLLGEVRSVRFAKQRSQEAKRLGYTKVISPETAKSLGQALAVALPKTKS